MEVIRYGIPLATSIPTIAKLESLPMDEMKTLIFRRLDELPPSSRRPAPSTSRGLWEKLLSSAPKVVLMELAVAIGTARFPSASSITATSAGTQPKAVSRRPRAASAAASLSSEADPAHHISDSMHPSSNSRLSEGGRTFDLFSLLRFVFFIVCG